MTKTIYHLSSHGFVRKIGEERGVYPRGGGGGVGGGGAYFEFRPKGGCRLFALVPGKSLIQGFMISNIICSSSEIFENLPQSLECFENVSLPFRQL